MPIWDLFSKREKRKAKEGQEDVFQYDELPPPFRAQLIHILRDTVGLWYDNEYGSRRHPPNFWWEAIVAALHRERGCFTLTGRAVRNPTEEAFDFIERGEVLGVLDLIEVSFGFVTDVISKSDEHHRQGWGLRQTPEQAVHELNVRFRENGIGYEFVAGQIVRVDSKYTHAESTKPALHLLQNAGREFAGPLEEFLTAHTKYRSGENKEAILIASHAFESVLKAICTLRGWTFDPHRDTASKLIEIVFTNNLIPTHLQNQFNGLRALLESGPHVTRNKTPGAGHGQGVSPVEAPEYLARYALNLAATNIVFLIESHQVKP